MTGRSVAEDGDHLLTGRSISGHPTQTYNRYARQWYCYVGSLSDFAPSQTLPRQTLPIFLIIVPFFPLLGEGKERSGESAHVVMPLVVDIDQSVRQH